MTWQDKPCKQKTMDTMWNIEWCPSLFNVVQNFALAQLGNTPDILINFQLKSSYKSVCNRTWICMWGWAVLILEGPNLPRDMSPPGGRILGLCYCSWVIRSAPCSVGDHLFTGLLTAFLEWYDRVVCAVGLSEVFPLIIKAPGPSIAIILYLVGCWATRQWLELWTIHTHHSQNSLVKHIVCKKLLALSMAKIWEEIP